MFSIFLLFFVVIHVFAVDYMELRVHQVAQLSRDAVSSSGDSTILRVGSKRTRSSLTPTLLDLSNQNTLNGFIVITPFYEINGTILESLIERSATAILIVLPHSGIVVRSRDRSEWRQFERLLLQRALPLAVYYTTQCVASDSLLAMANDNDFQLSIALEDDASSSATPLTNLYSLLKSPRTSSRRKTLAVVAHYDSFAAAPTAAHGGAGAVAVFLELATRFQRLYRNASTASDYDVLFLLTGGGHASFLGTWSWLTSADSKLVSSIDFALCLDSLGSHVARENNGLSESVKAYLHSSRPAKTARIVQKVYTAFDNAVSTNDVQGKRVLQAIQLQRNATFEHEMFARRRLFAATLSERRATTADLYSTPDALDRASQLSPAALRLHAAIAMETIAAVAYGPARARLAAQLALADDQVDEVQLNDNVESRLSAHAALAARLGVSVAVSDGVIRGALGPDAAAAALASALSGGVRVNDQVDGALDEDRAESDGDEDDLDEQIVHRHTVDLPDHHHWRSGSGVATVYRVTSVYLEAVTFLVGLLVLAGVSVAVSGVERSLQVVKEIFGIKN